MRKSRGWSIQTLLRVNNTKQIYIYKEKKQMSKNVVLKIVIAGAALFGAYKLYKAVEKYDAEQKEALEKHRKDVLEEIDGEINKAAEWNKEIKDITLNNENIKPSDRAYAYDMLKGRYESILSAKTIEDIDKARKRFEELYDILMTVKDPETFESLFNIEAEKRAYNEKLRLEKAERDAELEKYKQISGVIEKLGTKVICNLVQ